MTERTRALMQGNEAVVEGAIAAGMRFFAGYPITPSTEIAEGCALRLPQVGGKFIQMEDELASMAAVIGASAAGVKSMTATSGPGFSLKQENIGYAALAEIPCVIVDVQRAGPSTGLPTSPSQGDYMQARWGTHGDHPVIALSPSSVQEAYTEMIRAFDLSEKYRMPVILLMDEIVGHMREGIELAGRGEVKPFERQTCADTAEAAKPYKMRNGELAPRMTPFGEGAFYNVTGLIHGEDGFPTNDHGIAAAQCMRLMRKIEENEAEIERYETAAMDDADVCIVTFGGTARSVQAAVETARAEGIRAGMFRPVTVWPFPEKAMRSICERVKKIVVVELNYGQMKLEVERAAAGVCEVLHIGRVDGATFTPQDILNKLREVVK